MVRNIVIFYGDCTSGFCLRRFSRHWDWGDGSGTISEAAGAGRIAILPSSEKRVHLTSSEKTFLKNLDSIPIWQWK